MFQLLKDHLQGVQLLHYSSVCEQNKPPVVKFNLVCGVYCVRQQLYLACCVTLKLSAYIHEVNFRSVSKFSISITHIFVWCP